MANNYAELVTKHSCGRWTWKEANYCAWCGEALEQSIEDQIHILTEVMGCGPQLNG